MTESLFKKKNIEKLVLKVNIKWIITIQRLLKETGIISLKLMFGFHSVLFKVKFHQIVVGRTLSWKLNRTVVGLVNISLSGNG